MPAPIDSDSVRVPDWIRSLVTDAPRSIPTAPRPTSPRDTASAAQARAVRELRRVIYAAIDRFAKTLEFELRVSGGYSGGASFEDALGYLAARGKDFTADSRTMRNRIKAALMAEYENSDAIPLKLEFRETAAEAILDTIIARVENRLRDVPIDANSGAYTLWKFHHGFDSRVGVKSGQLLAALKRPSTQVKVST